MKTIIHFSQYLLAKMLFTILRFLPISACSFIGCYLGKFIASLPVEANETARNNIRKVLPSLDEADVQKIQQKATESFVQTLTEMPKIYALSKNAFNKTVDVEGAEHYQTNPNALILTAHYGNWECILKLASVLDIPMANVYRPANNPFVDRIVVKMREQRTGVQIPKGKEGSRKLLTAVKNGMSAGFLNDQKLNTGIESEFFGQKVMSASSVADLAIKFDRPVLPVFCKRTAYGKFKITIGAPLDIKTTGDRKADSHEAILQFNQIIEDQIREDATQWLWHHNRF